MSTMVDSKIGKSFQRSVGRAKEKILQNLGKVDRTADEILDEHITNFSKQQYAATRLQKELNNYIRCIRACSTASRALLEAVNEVYEPEWGGRELLTVNSQSVELLWNDFAHRLAEQVLIPLNTYQGQFPEMRKKIEKRGRKLVDFDGERHALQAMQSNPRRAEAKLARQRESLEAAKRTYDVLNSELHDELPALFNSRIVFLVSAMSTLFASEHIFHSESSKVFTELEGIVDKLAKESAKGTMNFKVPSNAVLNNTSDSPKDVKNGSMSPVSKTSSNPSTPVTPTSPLSKLPVEESSSVITSNGVPKSNGSIKTDTNSEMKMEKGNDISNAINKGEVEIEDPVVTPKTTETINENDNINLPETTIPSPSPLSTTAHPVNGAIDSAANHKNASPDSANPVIAPSSPSTALPDSSTTSPTTMAEASNEKAPAAAAAPPPSVNGNNAQKNDDGADKPTTPSAPEREEPDSLDKDMKTRAVETPDQDSLTSREQNKDSDKENDDSEINTDKLDINDPKLIITSATVHNSSIDENEKAQQLDENNNEDVEMNNNNLTKKEKPSNLKNGADDGNAAIEPKPLHGILSSSKSKMGNGRTESPENEHHVPAPSDEEPGVLYRVRATYRYQKEDVDELSFEAGEIIRVIEYDDPEEQEEGWLMGIKDNGEKGMFPANFTRPL